jgi:hypothetical protein
MVCGENIEDIQKHTQENHDQEDFEKAMGAMMPDLEPIVQTVRGENFHKQYATNWDVGYSEFDFRIDVMNERRNHPVGVLDPLREVIQLISEGQIIATPVAVKSLIERLSMAVEEFEKQFGTIQVDDGQRRSL